MTDRVYLDWNATAPLRPEARDAMVKAMDLVGNPSSVHSEGRDGRRIVEWARSEVAKLVDCEPSEIVFTSGATEAIAIVAGGARKLHCTDLEHDAVIAWRERTGGAHSYISGADGVEFAHDDIVVVPTANGEVGFLGTKDAAFVMNDDGTIGAARMFRDVTQHVGKLPFSFRACRTMTDLVAASSHKIGGPKGVGVLIVREGNEIVGVPGGGQEGRRRSGTENVLGIAGFGAAAAAALADIKSGAWERVAELRDRMEALILAEVPEAIVVAKELTRLPNTSCLAVPGWKGETQVMQMDLAGYAVSAGAACSSGKVQESRVLRALGYDRDTASSAIRVSLGPVTKEADVIGFARTWVEHYRKWKRRAA